MNSKINEFQKSNGLSSKGLGYYDDFLARTARKGRMESEKDPKNPRNNIIPQRELVRLAILRYSWVTSGEIATSIGVPRMVFHRYALAGHFGPTVWNLNNDLCLRVELRSNLKSVEAKYRRLAKKSKSIGRKRWIEKSIGKNEYTANQIAEMIGDHSDDGVKYWCSKGQLSHTIRHNVVVVKTSDLLRFIQTVLDGNVIVWKTTRVQLARLYAELTAD